MRSCYYVKYIIEKAKLNIDFESHYLYYQQVENIQIQVVQEFGFEIEDGLNFLRSAQSQYPNDPEISDIAYYIKYNRAHQGSLTEGDTIPDIQLYTTDMQPIHLLKFYQQTCHLKTSKRVGKERALVILAGSIT